MNKKHLLLSMVSIVIIGVIVSSYLFSNMSQRPSFIFATIKKGKIVSSIQVKGKVLPQKIVKLAFEKNGKVTAINFKVGDRVVAGTVLTKIDASDVKAQYKQATFLLASAKAILAKDKQDLKVQKYELRKVESDSSSTFKDKQIQERKVKAFKELVESQKSQVLANESSVDFFSHQLSKTVIKAPFTGVIAEKKMEIGQVVVPTVPVVTLISQNDYKIEAYVSQIEIAQVKVGDLAEVQFNNTKSKIQANALVVAIDPMSKIIHGGVSYKITLNFISKDLFIKSGEEVNIKIITQEKNNVLIINKNSLIQKGNKYFVLTKNNGKEKLKLVKVGIKGDNNQIEITDGLKKTDKVIQLNNKK